MNTVANERDVEKRVQEDSRLGNQDPGRPGSGEAQLLRYKVSFFSCFFFPQKLGLNLGIDQARQMLYH